MYYIYKKKWLGGNRKTGFLNVTFSLCTYYEQFICTRTSEDKNNFTNAKRIKYEI